MFFFCWNDLSCSVCVRTGVRCSCWPWRSSNSRRWWRVWELAALTWRNSVSSMAECTSAWKTGTKRTRTTLTALSTCTCTYLFSCFFSLCLPADKLDLCNRSVFISQYWKECFQLSFRLLFFMISWSAKLARASFCQSCCGFFFRSSHYRRSSQSLSVDLFKTNFFFFFFGTVVFCLVCWVARFGFFSFFTQSGSASNETIGMMFV